MKTGRAWQPAVPKLFLRWWLTALAMIGISLAQQPGEKVFILPVEKPAKEAPLFFSAAATGSVIAGLTEVKGEQTLVFKIHQGKPEVLSLGLSGTGEVVSVSGEQLQDWSVRVAADGNRFLDLRPKSGEKGFPTELTVVMETRSKVEKGRTGVLLLAPGAATTGFSQELLLTAEKGVDLRVVKARGLLPVGAGKEGRFVSTGAGILELEISAGGSSSRSLDLRDATVTGNLSADGRSVSFQLIGTARALEAGARVELFGKGAALMGGVMGEGWHVELRPDEEAYDLVAERAGDLAVDVSFAVPVKGKGDWRTLDFRLPAGVVVPVRLRGLAGDLSFDTSREVVPARDGEMWRGFLPASGSASMAWRPAGAIAAGALFFSSTETTDVLVGSGLLRQSTTLDLRMLQGQLSGLVLDLAGAGEVLSVTGDAVLGWAVREENGKRKLEVKLSRPIEGAGRFTVESQAALGGFPVRAEALRISPVGSLRHSGWLRVANEGAVRLEVTDSDGLIQLAPGQFPGKESSQRQVFVYRFPAADYRYVIQADQILPEVGVTETTVYELAETDRRIFSDLELDIREAPLREWELSIPADYAVASVTGTAVADYTVAGEPVNGRRMLKVLFKEAVIGRQLVSLRLEKNEAVRAGAWPLTPLTFPNAKSRRGYIGAVATAGYRLVAGATSGVAEVPVTFFPRKTPGLQQAFRLRETEWNVALTIEALGQSVQADVFHLYSLKEGAAYGSVLVNYFVVGAPATEWKISVPDGIGNIDVTGQNVGRDWRREGNTVIIPLSRPVSGTGTVLLTFEQPMKASGGELSPGEVRPLDVQSERGYIQVVSPLQVNKSFRSQGSLLEIEANELPAEFRLLSNAPTLNAWQYTVRDFQIAMKIEWFKPGETVEQVVDFMKLSSRISKDGQWVTDARLFVKSRGRNSLRMGLPEGASLLETTVDQQPVNAREDGKEILIPLAANPDPNHASEIVLRYGLSSETARNIHLSAPRLNAPVVIGEWTVGGDENRQLVPKGGTAELVHPVLMGSGWRWIGAHAGRSLLVVIAGIAAFILSRNEATGWRRALALGSGLLALLLSAGLALSALAGAGSNAAVLEYTAPIVAAGKEVTVEIGNVAPWLARMTWGVWLFGIAGAALLVYKPLRGLGVVLIGAAILSLRGGAGGFFILLTLLMAIRLLPQFRRVIAALRRPRPASVVATLVLLGMIGFSPRLHAEEIPGTKPAESMIHDWQIRDGRLYGTLEVSVRGAPGDRFLLLDQPAVLTNFTGTGLHVEKAVRQGAEAYYLIADGVGRLDGRATFEMQLGDPVKGWDMPSGPSALSRVTLRWNQGGWEFYSEGAAKTEAIPGLPENESGAILIPGPQKKIRLQVRPRQRDATSEEARFFSEVSNLFVPGPGVVNGRHKVTIRPAQGKISALVLKVPEGFTVSDVSEGPVGTWRFDPGTRELRMVVEPAQQKPFSLTVGTQRGADALPVDLVLEPLRIIGSAGEVGLLGLAFGEDAQPESVEGDGLSRISPGDFDGKLLPHDDAGKPLAMLQHVFRYGAGAVKVRVKVGAVAPELRAEMSQLVSLGEDRLIVATDLSVTISRAGVFRLVLEVPEGLEIESLSGPALSHWTESRADGKRLVTLHLTGKTLGLQQFSFSLSGPPAGAVEKWQVPHLKLRDASREIGTLTVVPERGLQVRAADRHHVSPIDPAQLTQKESQANRPGALAYRLLEGDWALSLAISRLDPWVTAQVFHESTLREGQILTKVGIAYRIENAAVKSLRVRIPGLDAATAATVRASGPAVADFIPVEGGAGVWEIRFQRGIAGETRVDLEYQRRITDASKELIEPIVLENVRQISSFVSLRAGGRLELETGALPRGWQRVDWAVVQSSLGQMANVAAPLMSFRVADAEGPLPVNLKRHELAGFQKLRVVDGRMTSLLSAKGDALTAVQLNMQASDKETLRLRLPKGAGLFNVRVNDEDVSLVREGEDWLFHVFPTPEAGRPATVSFVFSAATLKSDRLEGPVLNVPMENVSWRVLVPEGWSLSAKEGDFDLKQEVEIGAFRLSDYQSFVTAKRASDSQNAVALLDRANEWLQKGEQEKASQALSNAVRSNQLDQASDEDARVQLRQLKTQQAVLGLNTRRQKLLIDNNSNASPDANAQLERAAEANPVLRGSANYDPRQYDQYLEGNTADENAALKEIANRIVTQQLAAEPAPVALDVTLPERGTSYTFTRSVQVNGGKPMAIEMKLKRAGGSFAWVMGVPLLGLLGLLTFRKNS